MVKELQAVLAADQGFQPYVDYPDNVPLDQWAELNRSAKWNAFHFFHQGRQHEENCLRCPDTVSALGVLKQPRVSHYMPAAMFSVLAPRTQIPPHHGVANFRLVVHLPLVVPPGCGFRVGNQVRDWKVGEAWVFDDTIEHEAWNQSDNERVILICDVWNPRLTEADRQMISEVLLALEEGQ